MKAKRQSTVEPVFGTLINYLGMRKMNTIGIRQANKNMLMAAVAYNLKKYMKFESKLIAGMTKEAKNPGFELLFYRNVLLGYFNENELRNKESSTRLETNLV